jgi:hypothetical protein
MRIGILFANASVVELAPLGAITEAHFDKTTVPLFQDSGGGSIILTLESKQAKVKYHKEIFFRNYAIGLTSREQFINAVGIS